MEKVAPGWGESLLTPEGPSPIRQTSTGYPKSPKSTIYP